MNQIIIISGMFQLILMLLFIYLIDSFFNTFPIREYLTFFAVIVTMFCGDFLMSFYIKLMTKHEEIE